VTDVGLKDSDETPVCRKWCHNYGHMKAIVVSCLNLCPIAVNDVKKGNAKVAIAKVAAKRARDDDDESDVVEVLGIKKAAINK
jgi:hypothetical protein